MRYFALSSFFVAGAVAVFACSYGNYDGSSQTRDAAVEGGTVVLSRSVDPNKEERLQTPDTAFELTILAGTFTGPANVTIARGGDRLLDQRLFVPTYIVTVDKEPGLPVEVRFNGSDPSSSDPGRVLVPVIAEADGTFRPTAMVGVNQSTAGPSTAYWGLTRRFGTFSLAYEAYSQQGNGFFDVTSDSCLAQCCTPMNGGGAPTAGAIGSSCACAGGPNLQCFLRACKPNIASAIERCIEIANTDTAPVTCTPNPPCGGSGTTCNYPNAPCGAGQACCMRQSSGECMGQGPGNNCAGGIAIRCDLGTPCAAGTKCCVFETEAYCASTCPDERTWCNVQSDCPDGGANADGGPDAGANGVGPCRSAPKCPHGTCGTPPASCTN